jgi:hypothetical protein
MNGRGKWQGMLTIAAFNWPFYAAAIVVMFLSFAGLLLFARFGLRVASGFALASAAYFLFGSLGISHLIYDRSDLYRWGWLERALRGVNMRRAVFCHCGFDEVSAALRTRFGGAHWQLLDHFDQKLMTESSIHRARALFPPAPGTLPARYDSWPLAAESADVVLALLAIHELRSEVERSGWFSESRRCLRESGRVVLVEHVRDSANFLAFGPGFFHFHSPASWRRCWQSAGFRSVDEFRVTPFVRIFVLAAT